MKDKRKNRLLIVALLALVIVVGALAVRSTLLPPSSTLPVAAEAPETRPTREVLLYFGAPDASRLTAETRQIEECRTDEACVRSLVQALVAGPTGAFVPILPPAAALHGVVLRDHTAELNFSRELVAAHPGGSVSELLTVYALADTIAANLPHLRQIRLLIDGKPVETLKGHVALREAIKADFTYTRPVQDWQAGRTAERPAAAAGEKR